MKQFVHASSAIAIGLLIAAAFTFPIIVIGVIVGWFFIGEYIEPDEGE